MKRGRQRTSTSAVDNVPVQEPKITVTKTEKNNFGALQTGHSEKEKGFKNIGAKEFFTGKDQ